MAKKQFTMNDSQKEKYAELFEAELNAMERSDWTQPWVSPNMGAPCNLYRRRHPYQKSNAFWLAMLMQVKGWSTPYFLTKTDLVNEDGSRKYDGLQANCTMVTDENGMPKFDDNGCPVMEYERRFPVFFYKPIYKDKDGNTVSEEDYRAMSDEERQELKVFFYRTHYLVYNLDQTNFKELYADDYEAMVAVPKHDYQTGQRDEVLERMIAGEWICPIHFGGHSAHYSPMEHHIRLPERSQFLGDAKFYAVALHEMAHSTMKDLRRELDEPYEEFVAELTAACVCSRLGVGKLLDEQHITYVASWRKALRDDKDFIPRVIDHVQMASNFIFNRYDAVAKKMEGPKLLQAA